MKEFKLNNEPKLKSGFKTPENYFDDFSLKVLNQLPENETKVVSIFSKRKMWIYAVAATLVIAISIPIFYQNSIQTKILDSTTIENYLAVNAGISEVELIELLQENDLNNIEFENKIDEEIVEELLITNSNFEEILLD